MKIIDLTGKKFGRWTVIERANNDKYKHLRWLCKCRCGKKAIVYGVHLISGRSKSCGCLRDEIASSKRRLSSGIGAMRNLMNCYRQNAKAKMCNFELTLEQFAKLTKENCYYCGAKPNGLMKGKRNLGDYAYNGIDRVDNNKGYTIDNVVPCCKKCNFAKKTSNLQEFKNWIEKVYNNLIKK